MERINRTRDLKFFHLFGYRLDRIEPVDMFPWTYHIECVAEMAREAQQLTTTL